jgi:hypothetical protein
MNRKRNRNKTKSGRGTETQVKSCRQTGIKKWRVGYTPFFKRTGQPRSQKRKLVYIIILQKTTQFFSAVGKMAVYPENGKGSQSDG